MTKLSGGLGKFTSLVAMGSTMLALVAGFTWRFVTESTALSESEHNQNQIATTAQTMSEAQLIQYANQLALEREKLLAYQKEIELLLEKLYSAKGIDAKPKLNKPSNLPVPTVELRAAPVPGLAKPIQGNSNGS